MKAYQQRTLALVATILGSSAAILDGTIVNLALPKIAADLHAGFSWLQWVADAYLLSLSALILLGGSLGDIIGRKKVYVVGLVGFGVSSLLCALSPSVGVLVAMRLVQGVFGALLVPGALAIINTNFPSDERGKAIGRWTAWTSIAIIIGPLAGGAILSVASWRWIFLVNIPIVVACVALAMGAIAETRDKYPRRIDIRGAALAALALAGITFGLIQGPPTHWSPSTIVSLAGGVLLAAVFVWSQGRTRDPMLQLKLFKSSNFSGANIMTFGMYGALGGLVFALVIYLQTEMGYSSLHAGLTTLPVSLIMFLFSAKVGSLCARFGSRIFMTIGPIMAAAGMALLYFLHPGSAYLTGILPGMLLFSAGLVLTVTPLTVTVMASVPHNESGIASGINNAVARVAGLLVIAVLGLFGTRQIFHFAMALCAGLAGIAGVLSWIMIRDEPRSGPRPAHPDTQPGQM